MKTRIRGALCALSVMLMAGWPLASTAQNTHSLPLVLPAGGSQAGFVRIDNNSSRGGTVRITAVDDTGSRTAAVTLSLDANESVNFNSRDLEQGNPSKGLPVGVGDGSGSWRLFLETALNINPVGVHPHVGRVRDGDARRSAGNVAGVAAVSSRVRQPRCQSKPGEPASADQPRLDGGERRAHGPRRCGSSCAGREREADVGAGRVSHVDGASPRSRHGA